MRNYVIDTSRGLAAAGVFLAAVVHLDLWVQGFRSIATIGPLFMLNFVGGMIIGVGVLVWRHWLPGLAAAGFGAATVAAFWISVIHGLFGVKETATGSPADTCRTRGVRSRRIRARGLCRIPVAAPHGTV